MHAWSSATWARGSTTRSLTCLCRTDHLAYLQLIGPAQVLKSLERNFNGVPRHEFRHIVEVFFAKLGLEPPEASRYRTPLQV